MSFWKRNDQPAAPSPEPAPVEERSAAELMVESVRLLRESLKMEAAEKLAPVQATREADEKRLFESRELADSLGIRTALAYVVQKLVHRESWIQQDDKYRTPADGIYIKAGDKKREERKEQIGLLLTIDGTPYVLTWERIRGYPDGEVYGSAAFCSEDQQPLFVMDYSTSYKYDMEQIHAGEVTLLQMGEWVHDLVRLHERLRAAEDLQYVQRRAAYAAEKSREIQH